MHGLSQVEHKIGPSASRLMYILFAPCGAWLLQRSQMLSWNQQFI